MWYEAAKFGSKEDAGTVYSKIESFLRTEQGHFSVFRVLIPDNDTWHVVLIGTKPEKALYERCARELRKGTLTQLPPEAYKTLETRRLEREKSAQPLPGTNRAYTETHTPTAMGSFGNIEMEEEAIDAILAKREAERDPTTASMHHAIAKSKAYDAIVGRAPEDSPLSPGSKVTLKPMPFIQGYHLLSEHTSTNILKREIGQKGMPYDEMIDKVAETITRINAEKLKRAEKYLFTPSAIALLQAVYNQEQSGWIETSSHLWIELQQPISTPYGDNIKAIYINDAYPMTEFHHVLPRSRDPKLHDTVLQSFGSYKDCFSLDVIDMRAKDVFSFTHDNSARRWIFEGSHRCPWDTCTYEGFHCIPCEQCREALIYWSSWFLTAYRIIHREYATSPDPEETPYPIETQRYTEEGKQVVGKGKNRRFIKAEVTREVQYKLISFDVTSPAKPHKPEGPSEGRENWLTIHGKEERIYKRVTIEGVKRHYEGPHFQRLIERCEKEGSFVEEGKEYKLINRPDGSILVIGKVKDHSKYVPMLKPELKKAQVIKKVVAPGYETKESN